MNFLHLICFRSMKNKLRIQIAVGRNIWLLVSLDLCLCSLYIKKLLHKYVFGGVCDFLNQFQAFFMTPSNYIMASNEDGCPKQLHVKCKPTNLLSCNAIYFLVVCFLNCDDYSPVPYLKGKLSDMYKTGESWGFFAAIAF